MFLGTEFEEIPPRAKRNPAQKYLISLQHWSGGSAWGEVQPKGKRFAARPQEQDRKRRCQRAAVPRLQQQAHSQREYRRSSEVEVEGGTPVSAGFSLGCGFPLQQTPASQRLSNHRAHDRVARKQHLMGQKNEPQEGIKQR